MFLCCFTFKPNLIDSNNLLLHLPSNARKQSSFSWMALNRFWCLVLGSSLSPASEKGSTGCLVLEKDVGIHRLLVIILYTFNKYTCMEGNRSSVVRQPEAKSQGLSILTSTFIN